MAREKGTGNLQQEKSGRWTLRVGINGRRLSRSTGTTDRDKAEAFLNRFLAPLGLGATRLPLAEAWHHYEMSPNRRDIAQATLNSKRMVWMGFARWMEHNHIEIGHLAEVTEEAVGEYLAEFRCHHAATTYNNHVCTLREIFRTLAEKAGVVNDPWANVCLRADDSVSRRELTVDEVVRLYDAASKEGAEWKLLFMTGIYTGLRLGDCCRLKWENVNLERGTVLQNRARGFLSPDRRCGIVRRFGPESCCSPCRQPIHKSIHKAVHNSRSVLGRRRLELIGGEKPFKASASASFRVARRLANRLANRLPTLAPHGGVRQQSPSRRFRFGRSNTFSRKYVKSR